ncbi:MAG: hypothetical protein KGH53_02280 [Candidatus Micrarchaeota archaeon]|nr:hypothetical protein [Candidatus Micrarchaeota archaeon]
MPCFDQDAFNQSVLSSNLVGFHSEPKLLNSGRMSNFFVRWKEMYNNPRLLNSTIKFTLGFVRDMGLEPMTILGVPEGMSPFGVSAQLSYISEKSSLEQGKYTVVSMRKTPKDHGHPLDRYFIGTPKEPIVLVEDVTTTGLSVLESMLYVKLAGLKVDYVISLTDRMERPPILGVDYYEKVAKYRHTLNSLMNSSIEKLNPPDVATAVQLAGAKYFSMSDVSQLLPSAIRRAKIGTELKKKIIEEREKFGTERTPFLEIKRAESKQRRKSA